MLLIVFESLLSETNGFACCVCCCCCNSCFFFSFFCFFAALLLHIIRVTTAITMRITMQAITATRLLFEPVASGTAVVASDLDWVIRTSNSPEIKSRIEDFLVISSCRWNDFMSSVQSFTLCFVIGPWQNLILTLLHVSILPDCSLMKCLNVVVFAEQTKHVNLVISKSKNKSSSVKHGKIKTQFSVCCIDICVAFQQKRNRSN